MSLSLFQMVLLRENNIWAFNPEQAFIYLCFTPRFPTGNIIERAVTTPIPTEVPRWGSLTYHYNQSLAWKEIQKFFLYHTGHQGCYVHGLLYQVLFHLIHHLWGFMGNSFVRSFVFYDNGYRWSKRGPIWGFRTCHQIKPYSWWRYFQLLIRKMKTVEDEFTYLEGRAL